MESVIGRMAWSRAGRDKNRLFIIVGVVDDNHVMVADGELRRMDKPKKKKLKHLSILEKNADAVAKTILDKRKPLDADLRLAIIHVAESGGDKATDREG